MSLQRYVVLLNCGHHREVKMAYPPKLGEAVVCTVCMKLRNVAG